MLTTNLEQFKWETLDVQVIAVSTRVQNLAERWKTGHLRCHVICVCLMLQSWERSHLSLWEMQLSHWKIPHEAILWKLQNFKSKDGGWNSFWHTGLQMEDLSTQNQPPPQTSGHTSCCSLHTAQFPLCPKWQPEVSGRGWSKRTTYALCQKSESTQGITWGL